MRRGIEQRKSGFVIEKDFQYRFTLKLSLFGGTLLVAYGCLLLFFVKANYESLIENAVTQMPSTVPALQREFRFLSILAVVGVIILVGILFGLGLVLTQKIAGPLLGLQRRLRDFADGKAGIRLRLRKGDEFQHLERVFNDAMESADRRRQSMLDEIRKVRALVESNDLVGARQMLEELSK